MGGGGGGGGGRGIEERLFEEEDRARTGMNDSLVWRKEASNRSSRSASSSSAVFVLLQYSS